MANEMFDTQTSLVGSDAVAEALAAEPQPEPSQPEPRPGAVTSTDIGADAQPELGIEESQPEAEVTPETKDGEEVAPEGEGEEEETADDWLPTEQEKEFPLETLARYAARYGYTAEQLQNDANLQRLMKDSLNSDIAVRDRAAEADQVVEEQPAETEPVMSPEEQQRRYQERQQRSRAFVGSVVAKVFDQKLVNEMGLDLYKAFGVDVSEADDPGTKALIESAPKVGQTLARHLVGGAYDALPYLLLSPDPNSGQFPIVQMLESIMPGISGMWERSSYMKSWARAAHEVGGELPAYGTPEFVSALEAAAEKVPNFDEIVYRDRQGRVLPPHEQAYRRYVLLAKAISAGKKAGKAASGPGPASKKQQAADPLADAIKHQNERLW